MNSRPQRTLKQKVSFSGFGIHTGKKVSLTFCPAQVDNGIVFQRMDLPNQPIIPADIRYVQDTTRSTTIGIESVCVQTVEHVLAALSAYQIDNLCIQLDESELPVGDGSAISFVDLIEKAGIEEQDAKTWIYPLKQPLYYSDHQTHLIALPSSEYQISYMIHYPDTPLIGSQYFSLPVTQEQFKQEIAFCRTFVLYHEVTTLIEQGLILGGSLENAVVIDNDAVLSKEGMRIPGNKGLRAPNEMVRHKILDLIGDLLLIQFRLQAHIIAVCSGHRTNVAFGNILKQHVACNRPIVNCKEKKTCNEHIEPTEIRSR